MRTIQWVAVVAAFVLIYLLFELKWISWTVTTCLALLVQWCSGLMYGYNLGHKSGYRMGYKEGHDTGYQTRAAQDFNSPFVA
jgi:hypothetical protein